MTHTFAAAGVHKVKVYNSSGANLRFDFKRTSDGNNNQTLRNIRSIKVNGDNSVQMYGNLFITNFVFNNVSYIPQNSFAFCGDASHSAKLTFLGNRPLTIQYEAFSFNDLLREVEIPTNTVEIGRSAFTMCKRLDKITLPNKSIIINTDMYNSSRKNFTSVFRRCSITKVMFKGTLSDWAANTTYTRIFGEVTSETPDANGGYSLSYSTYAQELEEHRSDSYFTQGTPDADEFEQNSRNGLIKLYLISE